MLWTTCHVNVTNEINEITPTRPLSMWSLTTLMCNLLHCFSIPITRHLQPSNLSPSWDAVLEMTHWHVQSWTFCMRVPSSVQFPKSQKSCCNLTIVHTELMLISGTYQFAICKGSTNLQAVVCCRQVKQMCTGDPTWSEAKTASSCSFSSAVSLMWNAAAFCSRYLIRFVPGIGKTSSP